jgi:farnesyl diphosphate synthase
MAILAGDGLLTEAFALLSAEPRDPDLASRKIRAIHAIASAAGSSGMVGGQAIDLLAVGSSTFDEYSLQDMHARKTGALIRAAVELGAMCGPRPTPGDTAALGAYASAAGLAFQVVDDVLDVTGTDVSLGKTAGKDAAQGKPTYVTLLGLDDAKRHAESLRLQAHAALAPFGARARRLVELADWIVLRQH